MGHNNEPRQRKQPEKSRKPYIRASFYRDYVEILNRMGITNSEEESGGRGGDGCDGKTHSGTMNPEFLGTTVHEIATREEGEGR